MRPTPLVLAIVGALQRGHDASLSGPIRVLIVDDHELFTHALTATLEQDGRF